MIPLLLPLSSGVVLVGVASEKDLGDGDDGVAVGLQGFNDPRQSVWRVLSGIVEEDDAPGAHILQHPLLDLLGRDALLIQAVAIPYN